MMENQTRQEKYSQIKKYLFQQLSRNFKGNTWILCKMLMVLYLFSFNLFSP